MAFHRRLLQQLTTSNNSARLWFSIGIVSGLFAWKQSSGYRICTVHGESMRPTLNPDNTSFQDRILIRDFKDSEDLKKSSGSIVFALKNDRRLVKRLAVVEDYESDISGIRCWLESDAQKEGYYDSKIFGYVSGSDVKGKVVAIIFPLHRVRMFD